jgi:hypothetical protein
MCSKKMKKVFTNFEFEFSKDSEILNIVKKISKSTNVSKKFQRLVKMQTAPRIPYETGNVNLTRTLTKKNIPNIPFQV